jgi:hypothetical protein
VATAAGAEVLVLAGVATPALDLAALMTGIDVENPEGSGAPRALLIARQIDAWCTVRRTLGLPDPIPARPEAA